MEVRWFPCNFIFLDDVCITINNNKILDRLSFGQVDTNRNGVIDLEEFLMIMGSGERIVDNRLQKLVELHIKETNVERITTGRSGGGV